MKINFKTTLLLSSGLALLLNIWNFFDSALQKRDAFSPAWAYTDTNKTNTSAAANKASSLSTSTKPNPSPAATAQTAGSKPTTPDPVASAAARLSAAGLKPDYAALYLSVQARTGTPWQLLAAVHKVETGQSGSTSRSSGAGATGPMQFMPATWSHYAADGNDDGVTDIHNLDDAMLTAGRYLAAGGASHGQYATALYHYNHSWGYVSHVTGIANKLGL